MLNETDKLDEKAARHDFKVEEPIVHDELDAIVFRQVVLCLASVRQQIHRRTQKITYQMVGIDDSDVCIDEEHPVYGRALEIGESEAVTAEHDMRRMSG